MAGQKQIKKTKKTRTSSTGNIPGKKVDEAKIVAALIASSTIGGSRASAQFGVSHRTITRYQMLARTGARPDLAKLVQDSANARGLIEQSQLERVLSVAMDRLEQLLPTASLDKTLSAVEKLGELKIAGDAINGDNRPDSGKNKQGTSVNIYQGPVLQAASDQLPTE